MNTTTKINMNQVLNVIRQEAMDNAIKCIIRNAKSTQSCYIKFFIGKTNMLIRVSDHSTHSSVWTLRIDKINNVNEVRNIIKNKLQDASHRSFRHSFLGR